MIKSRRPSIRHASPPGARVVERPVAPDTPIAPSGKPVDAPPTYQEILHDRVDLARRLEESLRLIGEIHSILASAKSNKDRVDVIQVVTKAIEATGLAKGGSP